MTGATVRLIKKKLTKSSTNVETDTDINWIFQIIRFTSQLAFKKNHVWFTSVYWIQFWRKKVCPFFERQLINFIHFLQVWHKLLSISTSNFPCAICLPVLSVLTNVSLHENKVKIDYSLTLAQIIPSLFFKFSSLDLNIRPLRLTAAQLLYQNPVLSFRA